MIIDANQFNYGNETFNKICQSHEKCEGCPLRGGVPIEDNGILIQCNTGMDMKE